MGVASNPGPPLDAPPNPASCPNDVLASLEANLTRIDSSDDDPLVCGRTGRIVSRRVGLMDEASRSVCPVVDMAAEVSDGVERLPCRRRVVLHPQSPGGTPRSVQDNRFATLASGDTDGMPHVDAEPVPLPTWVDDESQRGHPRRRL